MCVCVCIFPGGSAVKILPAMQERQVRSLGWEDPPGVGNGNPLQYSCLENPHGQRSLAGYSPWTCKELDTTEATERVCVCVCVCTHAHVCRPLAGGEGSI